MDTITQPPHVTRTESYVTTRSEIESVVDAKLRNFAEELTAKLEKDRKEDLKKSAMTYGVGGVAGLVVGAGSVLLIQKLRRRPSKP